MSGSAERFAVSVVEEPILEMEGYVLLDRESGSEARVVPGYGATMYSFKPNLNGAPLEMMYGLDCPDLWQTRRLGNPILFQPLGRSPGGRSVVMRGEEYEQAVDADGRVKSVRSVHDLPWQVDDAGATPDGACLRCALRSEELAETRGQAASPFKLTATFALSSHEIRLAFVVRNVGDCKLPIRLGCHPWFRLPLSPAGSREDCLIRVPSRKLWDRPHLNRCEGLIVDVPPEVDFHQMRPLGNVHLDHGYTDLHATSGTNDFVLRDPAAGVELVVRADAVFREHQVYAPLGIPTICFEPWTSPTPVYDLEAQGLEVGLIVLAPGETWSGAMSFIGQSSRRQSV